MESFLVKRAFDNASGACKLNADSEATQLCVRYQDSGTDGD
jgi:hypothetical protein